MKTIRMYQAGGVVAGLLLWWILPGILGTLVGLLVIIAAVAAPKIGYLMLDPSQRRRLDRLRERKQI
jgi:hypothetical protein